MLLDSSKAFNKSKNENNTQVTTGKKLHYYTARNNLLNWIQAFLTGRGQQAVPEGTRSSLATVEYPKVVFWAAFCSWITSETYLMWAGLPTLDCLQMTASSGSPLKQNCRLSQEELQGLHCQGQVSHLQHDCTLYTGVCLNRLGLLQTERYPAA